MSFTFLGFLVFVVLATIKAAVKTEVSYSWLKACLPILIGLIIDLGIMIGFFVFAILMATATSGGTLV